jgi:hypothetical protein
VKATEHNARSPSTADICIGLAAQYNTRPSLQLVKFTVLGETRILLESFGSKPQGKRQLLLWVRFFFLSIEFLVLNAIYNFVFLNDKAINLIS